MYYFKSIRIISLKRICTLNICLFFSKIEGTREITNLPSPTFGMQNCFNDEKHTRGHLALPFTSDTAQLNLNLSVSWRHRCILDAILLHRVRLYAPNIFAASFDGPKIITASFRVGLWNRAGVATHGILQRTRLIFDLSQPSAFGMN